MIKVSSYRHHELDGAFRADLVLLRDAQSAYDSPFYDLDFAGLVASVRTDVRVLVAEDANGLLGYWALHVRPGRWARPIGGPFSDWHGPVLRGDDTALGPAAFLDKAGLRGMTAPGLRPGGFAACAGGEISASGIAHLPEGGAAAYLAWQKQTYPKQAKNLRRAERLIERDFGGYTFVADDMSVAAYEWLMAVKSAQYMRTGRHDVLAPGWVKTMMSDLRTERWPRLRGRLSTLHLGDKLAAAEFDLLSDKTVHGWITAFDQEFSQYSIGHLLMRAVICDMERTGHVECDVGTGDYAYKKYYETYQRPVEAVTLRAGRGGRPLAAGWRMLERSAPGKIGHTMQRMRRRGDQIFACETEVDARIAGFVQAIRGASEAS